MTKLEEEAAEEEEAVEEDDDEPDDDEPDDDEPDDDEPSDDDEPPDEYEYSDALEACKAHSTPKSTERIGTTTYELAQPGRGRPVLPLRLEWSR